MFCNIVGDRVRVRVEIGSYKQNWEMGCDLRGLRVFETIFEMITEEKVVPLAPAMVGVTRRYLAVTYPGRNTMESLERMKQHVLSEEKHQCGHGLYKKSAKGTANDLMNENYCQIYVANDEGEKRRMNALIRAEEIEGEWDGLVFTRAGEGIESCDCDEQFRLCAEAYLTSVEPALDGDEFAGNRVGDLINSDETYEEKFYKISAMAITSWPESIRDEIYWAGGKKIKASLASKLFVGGKMTFQQFFDRACERAETEWSFAERQREGGYNNVQDLVLGQMLRCKGQIVVDREERTVEFIAKPENYMVAQRRLCATTI